MTEQNTDDQECCETCRHVIPAMPFYPGECQWTDLDVPFWVDGLKHYVQASDGANCGAWKAKL